MTLLGKGFFTLDLAGCENGDPAALAAAARDAGLNHVILKVAEGTTAFGLDVQGKDMTLPFVQALKLTGIEVWGWQHVTGADPEEEARMAAERADYLGLSGLVVNAESEYESTGREASARQYMAALHAELKIPIALNSFCFPNFHPGLPWTAFLQGCDYHMPRVFWEQAHNAGEQLRESMRQCEALPAARPYIPCGAAYRTSGWAPEPADLTEFLSTACDLGLPAANFYLWDHCRSYFPNAWEAVAGFAWPTIAAAVPAKTEGQTTLEPTPPDTFSKEFITALNSRQAARVADLYDPAAVRTWANETVYGLIAIRGAYTTLFDKLPAGITFSHIHGEMVNSVCYFTWKAGPLNARTTLMFKNGRIIQDLTFIS